MVKHQHNVEMLRKDHVIIYACVYIYLYMVQMNLKLLKYVFMGFPELKS